MFIKTLHKKPSKKLHKNNFNKIPNKCKYICSPIFQSIVKNAITDLAMLDFLRKCDI